MTVTAQTASEASLSLGEEARAPGAGRSAGRAEAAQVTGGSGGASWARRREAWRRPAGPQPRKTPPPLPLSHPSPSGGRRAPGLGSVGTGDFGGGSPMGGAQEVHGAWAPTQQVFLPRRPPGTGLL